MIKIESVPRSISCPDSDAWVRCANSKVKKSNQTKRRKRPWKREIEGPPTAKAPVLEDTSFKSGTASLSQSRRLPRALLHIPVGLR